VFVTLGALLAMCAGALTASPALAGRGHKWQFNPLGPVTVDALFCGSRIKLVPVADKSYTKVLKTSDGSMTFLSTGSVKVSLANPQTGKTITENISGQGRTTVFPDGSVTGADKGHTLLLLAPADAKRFGLPGLSVTAGLLTGTVAADGTITSQSLHGHVLVDVCAALS
jgi:hypothetical protein